MCVCVQYEEDRLLLSGARRVPGLRTRLELNWQKEREEQQRLIQETATLAKDLRQVGNTLSLFLLLLLTHHYLQYSPPLFLSLTYYKHTPSLSCFFALSLSITSSPTLSLHYRLYTRWNARETWRNWNPGGRLSSSRRQWVKRQQTPRPKCRR